MDARDLEGIWEAHARHDPLWAILSDPAKKNRGWEIDRFFESGEREIRFLLRDLESIALRKDDALDFGCGVGRLTHPLSRYFDRVTGVDISPTMIELASELNQEPDRVRFVRNTREDLSVFPAGSFDFVYTNIVLQHVPPSLAKRYITEFLRVLRPGGVLVFQLPSHPRPEEELNVRAMLDSAYRAEIHVAEWPRTAAPSTRIGVAADVVNASSQAWHPTALGQINLANHWIAADGTMERQDDARAGLPAPLGPGERAEILIAVTTPPTPGRYHCELDLVHETITWFGDRGSPTCTLPIEVNEGAAPPSPSQAPADASQSTRATAWHELEARLPEPTAEPEPFPMFAVPKDEVVALLEKSGAELLSVSEDGHAGWEWVGYRYTIRSLDETRVQRIPNPSMK